MTDGTTCVHARNEKEIPGVGWDEIDRDWNERMKDDSEDQVSIIIVRYTYLSPQKVGSAVQKSR